MAIQDQLQADLTAAMKARDELTTSTLRMVRAAVTTASVAGATAITLTDDQVLDVLRAEAKKRGEAAEAFEQGGRAESAAKERAERAIIERYLPAAMSDGDLQAIVADEVARASAAGQIGPKAMGAVVKAVRDRVGSGAEGGRIAAAVKAML